MARLSMTIAALAIPCASTMASPPVASPPPAFSSPSGGFALPEQNHVFSFPADHGSHPRFRIEWWYVTGHLRTDAGRRFGFESTFFRLAAPQGTPAANRREDGAFGSGELYLAHMAVTDVQTGRFIWDEKLNRGGWDAGAAAGHLALRNGSWSLGAEGTSPDGPRMRVVGGVRAEAAFDLELTPIKPLVLFGENGVSRKGAEPSAASYYLTFPRLSVRGRLTLGGVEERVGGEAWMDHEISSSQLGSDLVGWDWICVQFDHRGRELMLYRLRRADGGADPASRLQWVGPDGRGITADYRWTVLSTWRSPADGAVYPARVKLEVREPGQGVWHSLTIEPLVADQELGGQLGGGPYWEGACRVLDESGRETGAAYMELTGYAGALRMGSTAGGAR